MSASDYSVCVCVCVCVYSIRFIFIKYHNFPYLHATQHDCVMVRHVKLLLTLQCSNVVHKNGYLQTKIDLCAPDLSSL